MLATVYVASVAAASGSVVVVIVVATVSSIVPLAVAVMDDVIAANVATVALVKVAADGTSVVNGSGKVMTFLF